MLGVSAGAIGQVAGDGLTGIYRVKDGKLPGRELPDNVVVEAYSWGALTSGVSGLLGWVRRAAWLLLLPFALLNIAYWARPELAWERTTVQPSEPARKSTEQARPAHWTARLIRVAGLLLTTLMVLSPATIGVDLLAWQCYGNGTAGCPVLPGALDFLIGEPAPRRVALGTLLPLVVIFVLWVLSRHSLDRYEDVKGPASTAPNGEPGSVALLRHPKLWAGTLRTRRLQRLHTSFAVCVVICYSGLPVVAAGWEGDLPRSNGFVVLSIVDVLAAVAAMGVVSLVCVIRPDDIEYAGPGPEPPTRWGGWRTRLALGLLCLVLGLLVIHLLLLLFAFEEFEENRGFLGQNIWFIVVFVVLTSLHVLLFVIRRPESWLRPRRRARVLWAGLVVVWALFGLSSTYLVDALGWSRWVAFVAMAMLVLGGVGLGVWHYEHRVRQVPHQAWGGAGASIFFAAAIWVGLLFTTSVVTFAANYLNGPERSVADLGTTYQAPFKDAAGGRYEAVGDVSIQDANILRTDTGTYVRSGRVEVDALRPANESNLALSFGTRKLAGASVTTPTGSVTVEDSCIRTAPSVRDAIAARGKCRVGRSDFRSSGLLLLPPDRHVVTLGSAGHAVQVRVGTPPQRPLTLPQVLVWAPLAQVIWILVVALLAGGCLARLIKRVRPKIDQQAKGEVTARDRQACLKARVRAAYVHRVERLLDLVGPLTAVLATGLVVGASTGKAPWELGKYQDSMQSVATLALWVALASSAGLVLLASRLRTSESARKGVGVLWDLTTFWPRAAHPFAPPCYAERVVPELLTRLRWALDQDDKRDLVVLSGHSQGSTLVVAAASRLDRDSLARVRIITYGSQLRAWYGRFFPAVFGPRAVGYVPTPGGPHFGDAFPDVPEDRVPPGAGAGAGVGVDHDPESLRDRLNWGLGPDDDPRWVNLFRRSDPLGFRVFDDYDSVDADVCVQEVPPEKAGDPGPRVMTHSGYQHTSAYRDAIGRWADEPPAQPPDPAPLQIKDVPFFPEA